MMLLVQMQSEQIGGPDGLVVAKVTRVCVDKVLDDRVDDTREDRGTTGSLSIREAGRQVEFGALLEAGNPVVDGCPRDAQAASNVADGIARAEPEESLGTAQEQGIVSGLNEIAKGR
jgi:hypothetical protein